MYRPTLKSPSSGLMLIILIIALALAYKYFDLRSEIRSVELKAMASSLTAASAQNFAIALTGSDRTLPVAGCRDAAGLLQGISGYENGENPFTSEYKGYFITDIDGRHEAGIAGSLCRVTDTHGNSAEFRVYHVMMD
jgi:hypothetical protein